MFLRRCTFQARASSTSPMMPSCSICIASDVNLARTRLGAVLHDALIAARGLDQQAAFAQIVRARLFDVHMLARGAGQNRRRSVPMIGRGHDHGVDRFVVEDAPQIFDRFARFELLFGVGQSLWHRGRRARPVRNPSRRRTLWPRSRRDRRSRSIRRAPGGWRSAAWPSAAWPRQIAPAASAAAPPSQSRRETSTAMVCSLRRGACVRREDVAAGRR